MARKKPSSALNGRLSQGPATQDGKDRSRFNAVVHGLSARRLLLLSNESPEKFANLALTFAHAFAPRNSVEQSLVECMLADEWRRTRAQSLETAILQKAIDEAARETDMADTLCRVLESKAFAMLCRYHTMLRNGFSRSVSTLAFIRKNFPHDESIVDHDLPGFDVQPFDPHELRPQTPPASSESPETVPEKLTFRAASTAGQPQPDQCHDPAPGTAPCKKTAA